MLADSKKQQIAAAIAEHSPSKLNPANKSMLNMSQSQLSDFASTPRKNLPQTAPKKKKGSFSI
jgi:hypothetical protein